MSFGFATRCVQSRDHDDPHGATAPPLHQTATFRQPTATDFGDFDYTRSGNPTRSLVERHVAALEGGAHGAAFTSGMAAIAAVTRLVKAGDEVLAGDDLYGGTTRLLARLACSHGVRVRHVDATDPQRVADAITERTRLVLVETPTNPLLSVTDLRALADVTRRRGVTLAVDNSLMSPTLQRPLELGADVVVHSATKFLGGHADLSAGVVVTNDPALHERIAFTQNAEGAGLAPFDCWLLLRSLPTLALRVERQCATAARLAQFLAAHALTQRVLYPGLPAHPGHAIHAAQASGFGAVLSFTTGDAALSRRIVEGTRLFKIAVSFGSVGSVISLPARMSHASVPDALRSRLAPPEDLVRISAGLEDAEDLVADLETAIAGVRCARISAASRGD